jgi:hypothetical protein
MHLLVADSLMGPLYVIRIDEIHTLVGAGSIGRGTAGSGLDISNLIKPALARGKLQCIGATTLDEHRKYIESDPALERRFQPLKVGEPSLPDALTILQGLKVCPLPLGPFCLHSKTFILWYSFVLVLCQKFRFLVACSGHVWHNL